MSDFTPVQRGAWARSCPECRQEKHSNCDGTAWDDEADDRCVCACGCRDISIIQADGNIIRTFVDSEGAKE